MNLRPSAEDEAFRREVRNFLEDSLAGPFSALRGRGGPGREDELVSERRRWERHLGEHGWSGVAWPVEHGGRGLTPTRQVLFNEEYARADAPGRLGHIGENLVGPTLISFGSAQQQARFLPPILTGAELWCQGYSEPNAGSDLANLATRAERDGDRWVINGQKVWTSGAHVADWCFVLARTDPAAPRHKGISYLLVPMDQPGIEVRPIVQMTGTHEFNEVFFTDVVTGADNVVGAVNDGWRVAMGTLAFERGASTLGQVLYFQNELDAIIEAARKSGLTGQPLVRQQLAALWCRLRIMRLNALRFMSSDRAELTESATITKLYWADLHRDLGEAAASVLGLSGQIVDPGGLGPLQRLFLFSRADTIYGGTDQIQRNVIGERALGLPKEPR
jgi:alkylation response protein AidB-like acyl-CoA dehydrogenase